MTRTWTDLDSEITIQGRTESVAQIWASFTGDQRVSDFLANDDRSVEEQCRAYAEWAAVHMADTSDDAPDWTEDDTDRLADALARYIAHEQSAA